MEIVEKVKELVIPILEEKGLKLVDIELNKGKRPILRVYIYNPEGTSIDDCEWVSKRLGALLDVEDLIPTSYTLEISSPGLDRKLKNKEEFNIFKGRDIVIKTKEPIEEKKVFRGVLEGLEDENVVLNQDDNKIKIPFENISQAKLEF
ncbi:ribosome maturation factor RimP [Venenivibrio stagnispumantis]|uniref:Ribosome maturation factor RimP n=1 Tax=Venenivibrio stagnispumantis TaxID=407998 RepID=A0AA46ACY0_9AQUI|nr:ribosome maturation factor RimP [Venenivibrio stagnispumantis]MCW4572546.1 ribosome maturation factor RimP [Venenivibrio stagnispumantis]SMP01614.1 ribosome maturation factor RimP [Venenivibrio stagnispumantis]